MRSTFAYNQRKARFFKMKCGDYYGECKHHFKKGVGNVVSKTSAILFRPQYVNALVKIYCCTNCFDSIVVTIWDILHIWPSTTLHTWCNKYSDVTCASQTRGNSTVYSAAFSRLTKNKTTNFSEGNPSVIRVSPFKCGERFHVMPPSLVHPDEK